MLRALSFARAQPCRFWLFKAVGAENKWAGRQGPIAGNAMRLRRQYLIAGIAWAVLLGPLAAFLLFGFAAGASWLWLFGDDPWPAATQWVLPLIGLIGGVVAALACIIVAGSYGRKREALFPANRHGERRKVLLLTATPLVLAAFLGAKVWWEGREYSEAMALATQREAAFAALVGAKHKIAGLTLDSSAEGTFRATVQLAGERERDHRLSWRVVDRGFGAALATGERIIRLQPGARAVEIAFTLDELARSYKAKVLNGAGGILVDEAFQLELSLMPVLSESERQELPPGERHRLATGDTSLRADMSTEFPVRFMIRGDGSIEK
jgi:hypothetical protein